MQDTTRHNIILAIILVAAGVFLAGWFCPYLAMHGHGKLCIALYVVLFLVFIYGRASGPRRRRTA
jgi:NADH:ubiquinone oxidoreductase subunit H